MYEDIGGKESVLIYPDLPPVLDIKVGKMNQSQYQFSKWRLICGVKLLSITLL